MRPLHAFIKNPSFCKVLLTHCQALKSGAIADIYTANNIIKEYTKCRELDVALQLFDEMPQRDTASWNTVIAGHLKYGSFGSAWECLKSMKKCGFVVDVYTFGSILKGIAYSGRVFLGQQVHSDVVKTGYENNVYSATALLDMYVKNDRVEDANTVFQHMPERNSVSWNALIAGYAEMGERHHCFQLLKGMDVESVGLDDGTFAPLLTLLNDIEDYKLMLQLHGKIVKHGLESNTTVCNALISAYSDCGYIKDARRVFGDATGARDLVSWNSMLAAYLTHHFELLALSLFRDMERLELKPDVYTYTSIISACSLESYVNQGKSLHALIIRRGFQQLTPISNSLISMYLNSNSSFMVDAMRVFEAICWKDLVSWNSILTGFSKYGLSENALKCFQRMRSERLETDHYSFSAAFKSCSDLATLQLGQQIHAMALKSGLMSNDHVGSSLIFMYSKCGIIEDAQKSFEETSKDSSITWNAMIFGYAQHGQGQVALNIFYFMKEFKVRMDHITFVAVLTACSHIGLVEEGCKFLNTMESDYGIPPRMEHYACAIDLLGRAGRLEDAKALIKEMAFEPDAMVWKTLLGACRMCGDAEYATEVAKHLLELEPGEHCTYVLLSSMYGHVKQWDKIASLKKQMKEKRVKKVPGWSWIEVNNIVHSFNAEDCSHSHRKEINHILGILMEDIGRSAAANNLDFSNQYLDSLD